MSSVVIRIPAETRKRLQLLAEPFTDTPSKVIGRLLDEHCDQVRRDRANVELSPAAAVEQLLDAHDASDCVECDQLPVKGGAS